VTETEQFLAAMSRRITEAEMALHNGDPGLRIAMWSRTEPLTLFAAMSGRGWGEIGPIFDKLGEQFSSCVSYENEILAAEARGNLAYTVALEHTTASINGAEPQPYVLRATTIFRREDGEWKVVHRHADALAADRSCRQPARARGKVSTGPSSPANVRSQRRPGSLRQISLSRSGRSASANTRG
jgi:ketosteroid isomerase-like protein